MQESLRYLSKTQAATEESTQRLNEVQVATEDKMRLRADAVLKMDRRLEAIEEQQG